MAKISVEIALAGGAEIEKQLADIGDAGQKAFVQISQAAEQAGGFNNLKPEEVTKKLQDMGVTGVDALKKIQAAVQSAGRLESIVQGVQKVEAAFGALVNVALKLGPAIVGAVVLATKELLSLEAAINKVNEEAIKLGVAVEKFDALRQSIESAGISAKGFSEGFAKVVSDKNKADLEAVTKAAKEFKDSINISGAGVPQIQLLTEQATKFTPAGQAAAKALVELGSGIPGTTAQDVAQLGTELAKLKGQTGVDFNVDDDSVTRFNKIVDALQKIPDPAQRAAAAFQFLGQAGPEFEQAFQTGAIEKFKQELTGITPAAANVASEVEQTKNRISAATERWDFGTAAAELDHLSALLLGIPWQATASAGQAAWNLITGAIQSAIDAVLKFLGLGPPAGATPPAGDTPGHAAGGLLGGSGSGTSDSNLAWVSRGEYIVPARAVAQPGVLSLLEALRRGMGHFALGGMVRGPLGIPAFAGGGLHAVSINFPGLPEITGLRGSSGVVDELRKAAAMAQVRSGGRKPSRFS